MGLADGLNPLLCPRWQGEGLRAGSRTHFAQPILRASLRRQAVTALT